MVHMTEAEFSDFISGTQNEEWFHRPGQQNHS
jgi:hypothetical protein